MKVIIITHGEAEPAQLGRPSQQRALTPHGRAQVRMAARRFRGLLAAGRIEPVPARVRLVSSPAVRCRQNVTIFAEEPRHPLGDPVALVDDERLAEQP